MKAVKDIHKAAHPHLDGRGWIGIASFVLTLLIVLLLWVDPDLRKDDFFQSISVLIIGTSWVNGVVSWAYSATQGGGELAYRNAKVVEKVTDKASDPSIPQDVKVVNPASDPAEVVISDTSATPPVATTEELPEYAR